MDKAQINARRKRARILIVDDHAVVREALTRLINAESDLAACGGAENAAQALEAVQRQHLDVAIVDIGPQSAGGLGLVAEMRLQCPTMLIIMLSLHDGPLYAKRALEAGAAGYVAKHDAAENITTAIRQVLAGGVYVSASRSGEPVSGTESARDDGGATTNSG